MKVVDMVEVIAKALSSSVGISLADDKISRGSSDDVIGDLAFYNVLVAGPFGMYL
jgi:hypothetical protein